MAPAPILAKQPRPFSKPTLFSFFPGSWLVVTQSGSEQGRFNSGLICAVAIQGQISRLTVRQIIAYTVIASFHRLSKKLLPSSTLYELKAPQLNTTLEVEGQKFPAVFKTASSGEREPTCLGSGSGLVHETVDPFRFIPCSLLRRCVGNFILYSIYHTYILQFIREELRHKKGLHLGIYPIQLRFCFNNQFRLRSRHSSHGFIFPRWL